MLYFSSQSNGSGRFFCIESTKLTVFAINHYVSTPTTTASALVDPHYTGSVVPAERRVLAILSASDFAQISGAIIGALTIYVINLGGPAAVSQSEHHSVC